MSEGTRTTIVPRDKRTHTRNRGTFQITAPVGLTEVRANTTIRFIKISGESVTQSETGIPSEWKTIKTEDIKSISTAVVALVASHLAIPGECVPLIWNKLQDDLMTVTVALTPLVDEEWENIADATEGELVCGVCFSPCRDADDNDSSRENCTECLPCYLCFRCRICRKDGHPICYQCLKSKDLPYVKEFHPDHMIRLRVLAPGLFDGSRCSSSSSSRGCSRE